MEKNGNKSVYTFIKNMWLNGLNKRWKINKG